MLGTLMQFFRSHLLIAGAIVSVVAGGIAYYAYAAKGNQTSPQQSTTSAPDTTATVFPKGAMTITSNPTQQMTDPDLGGPSSFGVETHDVESRQVTLLEVLDSPEIVIPSDPTSLQASPGAPGSTVAPAPGMRWIGLKFTVTSTTTCTGFTETHDFCLLLPGTAEAVDSQDTSLPIDDVMPRCPSIYQTPHGQGILEIGQSVTYCSAVEVPANAKITGITYKDGVATPLHWNVTEAKPPQRINWICTAQQANHWSGETPPGCTNTGAFRRVYSPPKQYAVKATVTLPSINLTLPPGIPPSKGHPYIPPLHDDIGWIYIEGWPGPNKSNFEAGLEYSARNNNFTFYTSPTDPSQLSEKHHFPYGDTVSLTVTPYSGNAASRPKGCRTTAVCIVATASDATITEQRSYNVPWASSTSFVYARMTTIGQGPQNYFNDGSAFGPVRWYDAKLGTMNDGSINWSDWANGGVQDWPDGSRIHAFNVNGETGETDLIDLHP